MYRRQVRVYGKQLRTRLAPSTRPLILQLRPRQPRNPDSARPSMTHRPWYFIFSFCKNSAAWAGMIRTCYKLVHRMYMSGEQSIFFLCSRKFQAPRTHEVSTLRSIRSRSLHTVVLLPLLHFSTVDFSVFCVLFCLYIREHIRWHISIWGD